MNLNNLLTIFECEKFEDRVNDGDDEGQGQEVDVCFQKSLFDRILGKKIVMITQGLISPTTYAQLLHTHIKMHKKYSQGVKSFFAILRSGFAKAARKTWINLTTGRF